MVRMTDWSCRSIENPNNLIHFSAWELEQQTKGKPRMVRAVFKAFWPEVLTQAILSFFTDFVLKIGLAIVLKEFLSSFQYEIYSILKYVNCISKGSSTFSEISQQNYQTHRMMVW